MTGAMEKGDIQRDRHAGRTPCEDEAEIGGGGDWSYKPRSPKKGQQSPRSSGEAWNRSLLTASEGADSSLQTWETVGLCHLSCPVRGPFSQQETNADYLLSNGNSI